MAKTVDNLMKMFTSTSEAHARYMAFAQAAEKEGRTGAAKTFKAVATAKMFHAISFLRAAKMVDTTDENIRQTLEEETYDYKKAYPPMVQDAVADDALEARHSLEYGMSMGPIIVKFVSKILSDSEAGVQGSFYVCPVCGNIEFGEPPAKCPFCGVDAKLFMEVA